MLYLLLPLAAGIAIVLVLVGAWWGGVIVVVLGLALMAYLAAARRENPDVGTMETARKEPTGTPRAGTAGAETANERVGQG
jgi:hypothetical protein